jgi:hypothetical protein
VAILVAEFKEYVGTKDSTDFPQSCLTAGQALVTKYLGAVTTVPSEIQDQAVLMVASELYHRRNAPNGISQFADMGGGAIRVGKDPMAPAYNLLLPYVQVGV